MQHDEWDDIPEADVVTTAPAPSSTAVATVRRGETLAPNRALVAGMLRPIAPPAEVMAAQNETRALVHQALKDGRDYGTIPGTQKPTMYKAGAERVTAAFGCVPDYEIIEKEIDHDREVPWTKRSWKWGQARGEKVYFEESGVSRGLYRYVIRCQLIHRESGVVVGSGIGTCSTLESKYVDRPRDLENTVAKMAKKRAFVDAVLTTFGLSDEFTQDVEDMDLGARAEEHAAGAAAEKSHTRKPASSGDLLAQRVGFGKHSDLTWGQVVEEFPDYVEWAIENAKKLSAGDKKLLKNEIEGRRAGKLDAARAKAAGKAEARSEKAVEPPAQDTAATTTGDDDGLEDVAGSDADLANGYKRVINALYVKHQSLTDQQQAALRRAASDPNATVERLEGLLEKAKNAIRDAGGTVPSDAKEAEIFNTIPENLFDA